jgi:hypothetical protein
MRTARSAVLAAIAFACALAPAFAHAREEGDPVPVASVQVTALQPRFDHRPAGAPRAVQYSPKEGYGSPSCGLLPANPKSADITPLVEVRKDDDWPRCDGVPEAAAFTWHGQHAYVFRALQRDTREDVYPNEQFFTATADEIEPLTELYGETTPEKKSVRWLAAWAKSRLIAKDGAAAGFVDSPKDAVVGETTVLLAGRNPTSASCRLVVDAVATDSGFAPVVLPCKSVLATASVPARAGIALLAMIDAPGQGAQGRVFVADAKGVREDADLERALQPAFATGRMLDVKAALKRVLPAG